MEELDYDSFKRYEVVIGLMEMWMKENPMDPDYKMMKNNKERIQDILDERLNKTFGEIINES